MTIRQRALARAAARGKTKGMTLLEIMIVIAILGLIASVIVVAVMNNFQRAKVNAAKLKIGEIHKALDFYKLDNNDYPSQSDGLRALIAPPGGGPPYLKEKELPRDSWGQEFVYFNPSRGGGTGVDIISKGEDKQEGTEDDVTGAK